MSATDTTEPTTSTPTDQKTEKTRKPVEARDVLYEIDVIEGEPEHEHRGGGGGFSPLEGLLDQIKKDETKHSPNDEGKTRWMTIGKYAKATAATAAANVLRQRHGGNKTVEGWEFATGKLTGKDEGRRGLFVSYHPNDIVDGAREAWVKAEQERKEKLAKMREENERKAKELKEQTNAGNGQPSDNKPSPTPDEVKAKAEAARQKK
jgi:hypothetical protein